MRARTPILDLCRGIQLKSVFSDVNRQLKFSCEVVQAAIHYTHVGANRNHFLWWVLKQDGERGV